MSILDLMSPGPMPIDFVILSSGTSSIQSSTSAVTFRSLSNRSSM